MTTITAKGFSHDMIHFNFNRRALRQYMRNRLLVLERDAYRCVVCKMTELDHFNRFGRRHSVHHRDGDTENNRMDNLETLCIPHHKMKDNLLMLRKFEFIVVVDIETTGLDADNSEIVEVGSVLVDIKRLNQDDLFYSLCDPGISKKKLEDSWICLNGYIDPLDVLGATPVIEVAEKFREILGDYYWTSYNLDFETSFLCRSPWNFSNKLAPDLMKKMTKVCAISMDWGLKWPTLVEAYYTVSGKEIEHHRAIDDARKAGDILIWLVKNNQYFS